MRTVKDEEEGEQKAEKIINKYFSATISFILNHSTSGIQQFFFSGRQSQSLIRPFHINYCLL